MGLFDIFFKEKQNEEKSNISWIALNDVVQLDEMKHQTAQLIVIFKHSTRCGISATVLSRFEKIHQDKKEGIDFYLLDLLNYRSISNEIAERFKITHQSPQIIVFENGKVQTHASHYDILEVKL